MQVADQGTRRGLVSADPRVRTALAGIVVLAAALRFSTLGVQSYWLDESYSAHIAGLAFKDVFIQVKSNEGNPPLYYYLAYLWRHVFGVSEFSLRSLSALFGTATVPAAFYAGRYLLASERAGLVTALLTALNPWLIWYSQEARSYILLVFFSAVALAFFARALRTSEPRDVVLWAGASILAVCSHYFAAFTILPEAAWLWWVLRGNRRDLKPFYLSFAGVAVVGLLLLPFALVQNRGNQRSFIHALPRGTRLEDIVRHPLAGELGGPVHGFVQAAAVLSLVSIALLVWRGGVLEKLGAAVAAGIVIGSLVIPFVVSFVPSVDFFFARNSLAVVLPMLIVIAAGLSVQRGGWIAGLALVGLCALWMAVNIAVPLDKKLQRDDWRGAAQALGPVTSPRVVATAPDFLRLPLVTYLHHTVLLPAGGTVAAEVDVVRLRRSTQAVTVPLAIKGFTPAAVQRTPSYELLRYRSARPVLVTPATLGSIKPSWAALVQR
ncbi:MAG: phospholipid carrier-dependent glycosyltransferase [Gaiellaceae bacterium]